MVKLKKNRSEKFLAFVSTRDRSGSRPSWDVCIWPQAVALVVVVINPFVIEIFDRLWIVSR